MKKWKPVVYVVKGKATSKNWYLRWKQPNGKYKQISSGTANKRTANRLATDKEEELRRTVNRGGNRWADVSEAYLKKASDSKKLDFRTAETNFLDFIESAYDYDEFSILDVDSDLLEEFRDCLDLSPNSVNSYLTRLRTFFEWCKKKRFVKTVPEVDKLKVSREKKAGGRALSDGEVNAIIDACKKILGEPYAKPWDFFIRGLCYCWDGDESCIRLVGLSTETPLIEYPRQKTTDDRKFYAVTPKFVEHLRTVKQEKRTGFVFNPVGRKGKITRAAKTIQALIHEFSVRANVITKNRLKNGEPKYASAHDFKRCFASWNSHHLSKDDLRSVTRHASENCLEVHYLTKDAEKESVRIQQFLGKIEPE